MGPRREMAVRNPSECHSVLPPSLPPSLSPPRWISAHCKPPINLLTSSRRRKLHSSSPPPSIFTLSPSLFFFLSILYFWAVWVNSTKGNFLFTLHRAFSLTRWHCDNTLWELRVSLMRCKCKIHYRAHISTTLKDVHGHMLQERLVWDDDICYKMWHERVSCAFVGR